MKPLQPFNLLQALTEEELREVFRDFDTSGDHQIDSAEFLAFFSRSVKALSNAEFDIMAAEMMD
jgi:Ca2+-binding EF-hand superfamily protein